MASGFAGVSGGLQRSVSTAGPAQAADTRAGGSVSDWPVKASSSSPRLLLGEDGLERTGDSEASELLGDSRPHQAIAERAIIRIARRSGSYRRPFPATGTPSIAAHADQPRTVRNVHPRRARPGPLDLLTVCTHACVLYIEYYVVRSFPRGTYGRSSRRPDAPTAAPRRGRRPPSVASLGS